MKPLNCLAFLFSFVVATPCFAQSLQTEQVAMRDGAHLTTDVWLSSDDASPRPVILRRTPYGRAVDSSFVQALISLGYALVSQDVRGRGGSEGQFYPFFNDAQDGADTIAWIAAQSWSNGRVGTFGGSAEGIVQLMALPEASSALRCAHVGVATADVYQGLLPGGAWRTELTTQWLLGLQAPDVLVSMRQHEVLDDFWAPVQLDANELARVRVPVFLYGGYYDIFASGTLRTHRALQTQSDSAVRNRQYLIFGPWTHGGFSTQTQGQITYPSDVNYSNGMGLDLMRFYGWCLKDQAAPDFAPVRYYLSQIGDDGTQATGQWKSAEAWPPEGSTPTTFYLRQGGGLSEKVPQAGETLDLVKFDPSHPLDSLGGGNLTTAAGPYDQSPVDEQPGQVLLTVSGPATEPVEIIGEGKARLWISATNTDTDVIVRIEDLTPSGKAMLLTDGIRRGRFARGYDQIRPLTPNEPVLFEIDLGPIGSVIGPGHALRIAISGTSSPRYEPNPGSATPLSQPASSQDGAFSVLCDNEHPAQIVLPIVSGTLPQGPNVPEEPAIDAGSDSALEASASDGSPAEDGATIGETGADGSPENDGSIESEAGVDQKEKTDSDGCDCHLGGARPGSIAVWAWVGLLVGLGLSRKKER